jgi:hypothetical protein
MRYVFFSKMVKEQPVPQLIETLGGLVTQYKKQHAKAAGPQAGGPNPGLGNPQQNPGGGPGNYGTAPGVPGFPTPPEGN